MNFQPCLGLIVFVVTLYSFCLPPVSPVPDLDLNPFVVGRVGLDFVDTQGALKTINPIVDVLTNVQNALDPKLTSLHKWRKSRNKMCNPRTRWPPPENPLPLCSLPATELPSGRPLEGNVLQPELYPPWINLKLARRGQAFAIKNRMSVALAGGFGLLVGLGSPDARNLLAWTGGSDTIARASRRYIATNAQMFVWIDELFTLDDDSLILESIARVRTMHLHVASRANAAPHPLLPPDAYEDVETDDEMWDALYKDLNASPLRRYKYWPRNYTKYDSVAVEMNQFIQGLTAFGFMGFVIMNPESSYIWDASEEEVRGYMHLWAIISYMMGVEDEYNVNLQPTVADAAKFAWDCQSLYSLPGIFEMDKTTRVMIESLAIALDDHVINFGLRRVMYILLNNYFKIPAPHIRAIFSPTDELAQTNWDLLFVPSTRHSSSRLAWNNAFKLGLEAVITTFFGPQVSRKHIARNVYYPKLEL